MIEEEKQVLVKALCGYLPYGVICSVVHEKYGRLVEEDMKLSGMFEDGNFYFLDEIGSTYSDNYIPYLRPMSSMTEEEQKKLHYFVESHKLGNCSRSGAISDYLNSIHIDYRGLIEKGLALEAPEGMYEIN